MKYIVKQGEPKAFSDWKNPEPANDDWQPTYDALAGEPKNAVKKALMAEQGYICCYCERQLTDHDSHIEHFKPQSDPGVDPLDFGNLLCSCQNRIKKGEPRHCGNLKDNWFDQDRLVSPLAPDCGNRFAFTGDGYIRPATDHDLAASETIQRLGLNIQKLNDLRAKAIEPFLQEDLSPEELQAFVAGYLAKDTTGRFGAFWSTIRHLFGGHPFA
jgi:uncharacterized protein (TIGR02646 family)